MRVRRRMIHRYDIPVGISKGQIWFCPEIGLLHEGIERLTDRHRRGNPPSAALETKGGGHHRNERDSTTVSIQQALDGVPACRRWLGWNEWKAWMAAAALEQLQADMAGSLRRVFADP
ncbi:hypothetical protein N7522_010704 [Penicillium canescens]|nr:hypothetical protein N7522_010704 [Penicillium canescens]